MVFQDQRCMLFPFVNAAGGCLLHDYKPHLHGGQFILHFVYVCVLCVRVCVCVRVYFYRVHTTTVT